MKMWKTAAVIAIAVAAAGVGAALAPPAHGQTRPRAVKVQSNRAFELFTGSSRIGVSIREVEESDAKSAKGATAGVVVEEVSTDSPASKAGIRKGDVIVEFDGEKVRSVRQLTRLVQETPAGRSVPAVLLREGQRTPVTVTPTDSGRFSFEGLDDLADWGRDFKYRIAPRIATPPAPPTPPNPPTPPSFVFDGLLNRATRLGISIDSLSPQLAQYFGTKDGVLVTSVTDDSPAAKAGLKAGDVITGFNGNTVGDPSELRRRIQSLGDGDEFTIAAMRDRKPVTLKGKVERTERRRTSRTIL
jgi:serine protease Do